MPNDFIRRRSLEFTFRIHADRRRIFCKSAKIAHNGRAGNRGGTPLTGPVHTGMRRLRRRATKTRLAPAAMTAHPPAASIPLFPGPVPPPVAGAPAGVLVVAPGLADVVVPVGAPVGVLEVVAVPVGAPELARAAGQVGVPLVVLARVQSSQ